VLGWLLLALAALDLAAFWLPNALNALLAVTGLAVGAAGIGVPLDERLIGGIAGFGALWLVAAGYQRLRGRQGLGGGDPKLFGAIGCWLGWQALPLVLLIACLIGLAAVLGMLSAGRRVQGSDRLAFGVLLAAASWTTWLGITQLPPRIPEGAVVVLTRTIGSGD
jgi:leader peptidase (prepilin peptidase) / N-methyltransferase